MAKKGLAAARITAIKKHCVLHGLWKFDKYAVRMIVFVHDDFRLTVPRIVSCSMASR